MRGRVKSGIQVKQQEVSAMKCTALNKANRQYARDYLLNWKCGQVNKWPFIHPWVQTSTLGCCHTIQISACHGYLCITSVSINIFPISTIYLNSTNTHKYL